MCIIWVSWVCLKICSKSTAVTTKAPLPPSSSLLRHPQPWRSIANPLEIHMIYGDCWKFLGIHRVSWKFFMKFLGIP